MTMHDAQEWSLVLLLSSVVAADLHHDLQPFKTQVMIFIMVMIIKRDLHKSHVFVLKPTDFSDGPAAGSQRRSGGKGDCTGKPDGKIVKEKYKK